MSYLQKFAPEDESNFEPDYPTAFGITFTPIVSGIVLTLIGLGVAGWLWTSRVQPLQTENTDLKQQRATKQQEFKQAKQTDIPQAIASLNQEFERERELKQQILGLLSDQQTFDTLLLDINNLVALRGAKLTSYKIEEAEPTIINDGSLGTSVNGKLKRQTVSLEIGGDFDQIENILRDIERLQTLLLVENLDSRQTEEQKYLFDDFNFLPQNSPELKTTMTLKVLSPLTPVEREAQRKAAEKIAKKNKR